MKKKVLLITLMIVLLCSCKNENNEANESNIIQMSSDNNWQEYTLQLSDELNEVTMFDNYFMLIPSWNRVDCDDGVVLSNDVALLAFNFGSEDNYKDRIYNYLSKKYKMNNFKKVNSSNDAINNFEIYHENGDLELDKNIRKSYVSYQINNADIKGYVIGISLKDDKTGELNQMIGNMIKSIEFNVSDNTYN